ncbi:hypothetical protein Tco_0668529 [Tanacetum coccineum]
MMNSSVAGEVDKLKGKFLMGSIISGSLQVSVKFLETGDPWWVSYFERCLKVGQVIGFKMERSQSKTLEALIRTLRRERSRFGKPDKPTASISLDFPNQISHEQSDHMEREETDISQKDEKPSKKRQNRTRDGKVCEDEAKSKSSQLREEKAKKNVT